MNTEEWLEKLISFDTTSRHSNKALIDYISNALDKTKMSVCLTYNEARDKANLFATIPAKNGQINEGLVLSGHTDVVPVDGQAWDTPPFTATKISDRIYGRGACDMKGFLAVILSLLPHFLQLKLAKPLHLAFSYDEEVGCLGVPSLIHDFQKQGIRPGACIVGEPTLMRPVIAHKGIQVYTCRVTGRAAHSSLVPEACNAIEHAATLVHEMRRYAESLKKDEAPFFDVPFTTLTTNLISGGIASNIVPESCEFNFEFRNLPSASPQKIFDHIEQYANTTLLPRMRQEYPKAKIEFIKKGAVPAFETTSQSKIVKEAQSICPEKETRKVSYATEAGIFQQAGIATVLCGPGSITEAHRPNEYVALLQLKQCESFLQKIVDRYCVQAE